MELYDNKYTKRIPQITKNSEAVRDVFQKLLERWYLAVEQKKEEDKRTSVLRQSEWKAKKGYKLDRFLRNGVALEVLSPEKKTERVILYIHGGSFLFPMLDVFTYFPQQLAEAANATVVCVDYRVAPQYTYQEMLEDLMQGYQWIQENDYECEQFFVVGDSSGGTTALAFMLYLRDLGCQLPAGVIALSAGTDLTCSFPTHETKKSVDLIFGSISHLEKKNELFVQDADIKNPYISPYYGDYHGLSAILLQVGEDEVLLDDSLRVAKKAKESGVDVICEVYEGMFHTFQQMQGLLSECDVAYQNMVLFMEHATKEAKRKDKTKSEAVQEMSCLV